ncbi:MAG: transposase [Vicinamibacteria bacterium]|nr:transposase [Vicinamibacteria bacterium]
MCEDGLRRRLAAFFADLRLNPHVHAVFLDGAWYEQGDELAFAGLGHLRTTEVGEVLECTIRRFGRHLRHRGLLREDPEEEQDAEANLAVSAVSGQIPAAARRCAGLRAGPRRRRRRRAAPWRSASRVPSARPAPRMIAPPWTTPRQPTPAAAPPRPR